MESRKSTGPRAEAGRAGRESLMPQCLRVLFTISHDPLWLRPLELSEPHLSDTCVTLASCDWHLGSWHLIN